MTGSATPEIRQVFFDIGGVLGSNGWDREQRLAAVERFGLDAQDFQDRHEEVVGALEVGAMTLDEYLEVTVFSAPRPFTCDDFKRYMLELSEPWPASIALARALRQGGRVRLATLNNESRELNVHRVGCFGLRDIFDVFFTSCWLGVRKPARQMYERVLGMTRCDEQPERALFIDDREQNLTPARALGMKTIRFQSAEQLGTQLRAMGLLA
jgi:putative hydrolase of the HAD superfamily